MTSSLRAYAGRVRLAMSRRVPRGAAGLRLGAAAGSSLEFHDYRDYHPGDDVRLIDWNVFARSDKETIRRHREEVSPVMELYFDASESMRAEGGELAPDIADLLENAASRAGCRSRRRAFGTADANRRPPALRSIRIVLSDLLVPGDPDAILAPIARDASALHVVRVLPLSERRPGRGSFLCIDSETGEERDLRLDAAALAAHADALARHTESWTRAVRRNGGTFTDLTAGLDGADDVVRALVASGVLEVV